MSPDHHPSSTEPDRWKCRVWLYPIMAEHLCFVPISPKKIVTGLRFFTQMQLHKSKPGCRVVFSRTRRIVAASLCELEDAEESGAAARGAPGSAGGAAGAEAAEGGGGAERRAGVDRPDHTARRTS